MDNLATKLDIYFKAGLPILFLHTFEETKAINVIHKVTGKRSLMEWSALGFRSEQGNVEFEEFDLLTILNLLLADTDILNNKVWNCLCAKEKQEMRLANELVQYQKLRY